MAPIVAKCHLVPVFTYYYDFYYLLLLSPPSFQGNKQSNWEKSYSIPESTEYLILS